MKISRLAVGTASIVAVVLAAGWLAAAIALSTSTPYTQNFDGIGTTTTATLPADFKADRLTTVRTVGSYAAAGTATTQAGGPNLSTMASNGIYNFGSGVTATGPDRAIGFLSSSGGTTSGNLYGQFVNNTGTALSGLRISYDVEKYRNGSNTAGFSIQLYYSTNGSTWKSAGTDFLTSFPADANNSGFATAPGATVTVSDRSLSVAIPTGSNVYLAWNYAVSTGSTVTNAQALAIDNISVVGIAAVVPANPSGMGSADPSTVLPGGSTVLSVAVTPGANPTSTGVSVTGNLSSIGGPASQPFLDQGNNTFTFEATVAFNTAPGPKTIPITISDAEDRSGAASINLTVEQPPPPIDHIVISQIYGGGGNSGATYRNDYVELFNPATTSFDLAGWSLQYASATGSGWGNTRQPLGGVIAPGEYYLIALASGGAVGAPLPAANIVGEINMGAMAGKIALVRNGEALVGGCPLADLDLVDFVGYGTTAGCWEGTTRALAPSNTTALFRKNDGGVDTNNNGNDFVTGAPNPHRTAPITEIGPSVFNTDPGFAGVNAPRDASITVNFTEAVDVTGAWYHISCDGGVHDDATVANTANAKTYVITPNTNFQAGEQCTVTILKDHVHDEDNDDITPNTDALAADYSWTFTVATGLAPPYLPDVHLATGNPSEATPDAVNAPNNYLMEKPEFALSYNSDRGAPNWVSWHLSDDWVGTLPRNDTFRPDPAVPKDWYRVQAFDYFTTGFDRGHMTPSADRDKATSIPINQATFLMSNMVPQAPDNNQGPWAAFENYLRDTLLPANELYIVAGGAGTGGTGSSGFATTIANGHVTVPAQTWKVVLVLPKGNQDLLRVSASTRTIAVIMPNIQGIRDDDWHEKYLVSVDQVEQLTGYDFFSNVPEIVQNSIEAGVDGVNPPGVGNQLLTTKEDEQQKAFTLEAVSPNNNPLTYDIVSAPSHGALTGTGSARTYTPVQDFNGNDTFSFRVNDGVRDSNTGTVTISVLEVNDDPTAGNDAKTTNDNTAVSFPASDLTANDTAGPANESGQTLTVTGVAATADTHGTVALLGGQVTYTPAAHFSGAASFTYQVSDNGYTAGLPDPRDATGTVEVTVVDTTPPAISNLGLSATEVWPPNHKMVDIAVGYEASDFGDPSPVCSLSVTSNEPVNGTGDGDTAPDWEVVDAHHVRLRAERAGGGTGRIYTIMADCQDRSDNHSHRTAAVTVPNSQGKGK